MVRKNKSVFNILKGFTMFKGIRVISKIVLALAMTCFLYGCIQNPKILYIPDDISSVNPSELMLITWTRPTNLLSIDSVTVAVPNVYSVYLRPGNHTFEYNKCISRSEGSPMGGWSGTVSWWDKDKRDYTGQAGKTYYWNDLIQSLDPEVYNNSGCP